VFSRRTFIKFGTAAGSVALAGLDLRAHSWISPARADTPLLEGAPSLDGALLFDEPSRVAIAVDHSNLYHRIPAAVLRPGSVQDIVKVVQYANQRSLKVVMKGRGHSQYGQTQAEGGIVIDSGNLNAVEVKPQGLDAQAGALWTIVATASLAKGT
jgi:cytokinin dehydrogenase